MALKSSAILPVLILLAILCVRPAHAFGAGNIQSTAKVEGVNWRHGDIEDTLLTLLTARVMGGKKFSKLDVKRTYFGNWLRDYSQAIDVGTVKSVSAEAIRLLLWVLAFMSFGYGTGEFEVTRDRLGCYRPEEHIDNPKDYADNLDARQYDRRLRGPVDEQKELSIDERTGLKRYIASEDAGITTSAGLVRNLFGRCIELGRRYKQSRDDREFYEALRLLGTGCHCLEDFSAHSNFVELSLIELGERDVFPHVGRRTQIQLRGVRQAVYPIVTGTFGGVDFLHSVLGEFSDKAAQSEIQELEGALSESSKADTSLLKELLNKLPPGLFGGTDQAGKADQLQANAAAAQMQNLHVSPKEPEAFTQQAEEISRQIYPILEFHDTIMKNITETIDNIPVLPDLIEQIQAQVSLFVFSLLAPYVVPIINQVKNELQTGSSEVIQSSRDKQLIVFHDDRSTDPTHSMLSKDHFSNVLNEPAGKVASQVLKWVVPQIVACWDDDRIDIGRTMDRIVAGVFHHPALRDHGDDGARDGRSLMFGVVQRWWSELDDRERDDLREKLSRGGVESGRNHKEGVHDVGHGCGKPIGLSHTSPSSGAMGGAAGMVMGGLNEAMGGQTGHGQSGAAGQIGDAVGDAVGGGALGSIVGGLAGAVGGSLLGSAFSGDKAETKAYGSGGYEQDGSYTSRITETGYRPSGPQQETRYGQAEVTHTQYASGGHRDEYQRYEQDGRHGETGYGFQQSTEVRPSRDGGYEQRSERRYEHPGGRWESEVQEQHVTSSGRQYVHEEHHSGHKKQDSDDSDDDDDDDDWEKKERKRKKKEEKRLKKLREQGQESGYSRHEQPSYESNEDGRQRAYGSERTGYGGDDTSSYGRQQEYNSERRGYGGDTSYGQQSYRRADEPERSSYGGEYGQREDSGAYGSRSSGYNRGGEYERRDDEEMPGSFGGGEDYGSRRDNEERGGYEGNNRW